MQVTKLFDAIEFAMEAHYGQTRKYDGLPYIVHPIAVMTILREYTEDEDLLIAAVLHDTVEDTAVTLEDIENHFGYRVSDIVYGLTDIYTKEAYPEYNRAQRKRLEALRLGNEVYEVQLIKVCDITHNTSDIVKADPGFAKKYVEEKKFLLEQLTKAPVAIIERAKRNF